MKTVNLIFALSLSLLVLGICEGIVTLGAAYDFSTYNTVAWIMQVLLVILAICVGIKANKEWA